MPEASEAFWSAFCHSGSSVQTCVCGRVHFCSSSNGGWSWEEGELEKLLEKSEKNPDQYCEVALYDSISWMDLGAGPIVYGCKCEGARRYEAFVWDNRGDILTYLRKKLEEIKDEERELAKGLEALK